MNSPKNIKRFMTIINLLLLVLARVDASSRPWHFDSDEVQETEASENENHSEEVAIEKLEKDQIIEEEHVQANADMNVTESMHTKSFKVEAEVLVTEVNGAEVEDEEEEDAKELVTSLEEKVLIVKKEIENQIKMLKVGFNEWVKNRTHPMNPKPLPIKETMKEIPEKKQEDCRETEGLQTSAMVVAIGSFYMENPEITIAIITFVTGLALLCPIICTVAIVHFFCKKQ